MNNGSYVQSNDASIRFGQTVETSGIVASIDVLPDDVNTPPTLSDNGEIPMTANSILRVYVKNLKIKISKMCHYYSCNYR